MRCAHLEQEVAILFTDGWLEGLSGQIYHIKVMLFKGHGACKPGEWRADANDLVCVLKGLDHSPLPSTLSPHFVLVSSFLCLFLSRPFRLLTPLYSEPTYWDNIVDGDVM